ncbi:hypothetical protein KPL74_15435 [Bacillus sp. NP157]|nr:hypothetical protein KPL74_15435 [Bacillus sp. NP157]
MAEQRFIDYHIAWTDDVWAVYRDDLQMATRRDAADAIALANFFADREALLRRARVRVSADKHLHRALRELRLAA